MQLIRDHLHHWEQSLPRTVLKIDRLTLAKRRWRGTAADGTEFGFDLEHPLQDGDVFEQTETTVYAIEQQPEPVLEIALSPAPPQAARLGWLLGNLHFQIEVTENAARIADDPAVRQLCDREHLHYTACERVFHPHSGGHSHGHHSHAH